jgi:hypothetical protein
VKEYWQNQQAEKPETHNRESAFLYLLLSSTCAMWRYINLVFIIKNPKMAGIFGGGCRPCISKHQWAFLLPAQGRGHTPCVPGTSDTTLNSISHRKYI